ncbi:MAG: hypothetical protein QOE57_304 [Acidimicrobiaceae bacterium]|nr:hypothetical protein [Acidimicrobiaceae bacterium]
MNTDRHDGCTIASPASMAIRKGAVATLLDTWMNAAELGRANEFIQLVGPHTTGVSAFGSELCNSPSAPQSGNQLGSVNRGDCGRSR